MRNHGFQQQQPPVNHGGRIMTRSDRESITLEAAELSNVRCRSFNQRATQGNAAAIVSPSLSGDHRRARGPTRRHTSGVDCVSQRLSRVAGGGLLQRPAQVTDCVLLPINYSSTILSACVERPAGTTPRAPSERLVGYSPAPARRALTVSCLSSREACNAIAFNE